MLDHAGEVPRIACWFFEQWRSLYEEEPLASVEHRIRTWLTRNQIPTAFVAVHDKRVVGTVALKPRDCRAWTTVHGWRACSLRPSIAGEALAHCLSRPRNDRPAHWELRSFTFTLLHRRISMNAWAGRSPAALTCAAVVSHSCLSLWAAPNSALDRTAIRH